MKSNHILTNTRNHVTTSPGRKGEQEAKKQNAIDAAINNSRK